MDKNINNILEPIVGVIYQLNNNKYIISCEGDISNLLNKDK